MPARVAGRDVTSGPRRRAGVLAAAEIRPIDRAAPWGEPWVSAWRIGDGAAVLLVGPPGSGKSTLAMQLAASAARRVGVLVLAVEEGHSVALAERIERAGLDDLSRRRLRISDARTIAEVDDDLAAVGDAGSRVVILDSVSELRCSPTWLAEAMHGRTLIALAHANVRGTARHAVEHEHAVDAVIDIDGGVATPRKNRYGGMAAITIWETRS
jgi:predicted ATP-dependent serine protease